MLRPATVLGLLATCLVLNARASIDPKDFDLSIRPQDDFYGYANGGWIKRNPIPADRSSWGTDDQIDANNERILHEIAEKAATAKHPGFIEKMVGDFYASGMDQASADSLGAAPLKPLFDRIASITGPSDFPHLVAELHRAGVGVCFSFGSEQDPKNSAMMIAGQGQGGLGLPDRDYYLRDDDGSKALREKYVAHVAKMLRLSGEKEPEAGTDAQAVMRLETSLAKASKSAADLRDPVANYHPMALGDVGKLSTHFDWGAYFSGMGLSPVPASVDIGQPEFLQGLDREIAGTSIQDWKAYFRWHLIHDNARYLSSPFVDENFAFFAKELTGTPQPRERWKRVLSVVDENVGEALGQLYVAVAFPPESKARVLKLVGNVRLALRERLQHLEWMDEPTRAAAVAKLDAMGVKIGYPDKWIDYSTLVIDRGPYVLNVLRSNEFAEKRDMAKIGKPVDRTLWGMTPPTVNAYNNIGMNEIVFAAGYLQPPLFDPAADDAANYGAIAATVGHEMTHSFDDEGRQFDKQGNLSDWWSAESAKRFKERAAGIVRQFSAYVAVDNLHVNGELTQGENIADLGGLRIAYAAFEKAQAGKSAAKVDGFTPQQRFFLSYAMSFRSNDRPESLRLLVNTDPHAPNRFRVNGPLSNLDEFAQAFAVPEGAPMRRAPADRVVIW